MREAVICRPLRTPVCRFGGGLKDVPPQELAAIVVRALMSSTGLSADAGDDVMLGHCYPTMRRGVWSPILSTRPGSGCGPWPG